MIIQSTEQVRHPIWYRRAGHLRHARDRGKVRYGHDARHDLRINAGRGNCIPETEEGFGFKKELRNCAARPGVQLAF